MPQSDVIEQSIVRLLHGRKQFQRCDRQLASVQMRRFSYLYARAEDDSSRC
jgi:hypothetical protein